jgi:thiamine kinase-like enzyme
MAEVLSAVHRSGELKHLLAPIPSEAYSDLAVSAAHHISDKWQRCRGLVPAAAGEVDAGLETLLAQAQALTGTGSAASHNDICNANWLISVDGQVYLIDLDAMTLDDPALDLGAFLWWYFPPERRADFLNTAGYKDSPALRERMRVRLALHCLNILLPRADSFDRFEPDSFEDALVDFRATLAGEENPQGYPGWNAGGRV